MVLYDFVPIGKLLQKQEAQGAKNSVIVNYFFFFFGFCSLQNSLNEVCQHILYGFDHFQDIQESKWCQHSSFSYEISSHAIFKQI